MKEKYGKIKESDRFVMKKINSAKESVTGHRKAPSFF